MKTILLDKWDNEVLSILEGKKGKECALLLLKFAEKIDSGRWCTITKD